MRNRNLLAFLVLALASVAAPGQVFRTEQEFFDALGCSPSDPFFLVESFETLDPTNDFTQEVIDAPNLRISEPFVDGALNLGVWNQPEKGRHATDGTQYVGTTTCLAPQCKPSIKRLEPQGVPTFAIGINIVDWTGTFNLALREDLTGQEIVAAFGGQPVGNEQFVGWIVPEVLTGYWDLVDPFGVTYAIDEVYTCGDILSVDLQSVTVD